MIWLYNLSIILYRAAIQLASFRNEKAKQWITGRKNLWAELHKQLNPGKPVIWIHSASTGEFEQAKPVIEQLKQRYPNYKILTTFFSPSGYNAARNYTLADYKFYLPLDTPENAQRFINAIQPRLVIFVKYEFWYHYLKAIHSHGIPLLLISAGFRKNQAFFKSYGGFYKKMLGFFTHIFVQDTLSLELLKEHKITHCSISGDTRFDRVTAIEEQFSDIPPIVNFTTEKPVLVAGSTWPDDEDILSELAKENQGIKFIIAPHEIEASHIEDIIKKFPGSVCYSSWQQECNSGKDYQTLIIDNIGMLSRLYKYASIAYVGGGFTKSGIHNVLEAAVFAKPVIIGPNYKKFREAHELIATGGVFSITNAGKLKQIVLQLLNETEALNAAGNASAIYVENNKGATERILRFIQEKRLLTN